MWLALQCHAIEGVEFGVLLARSSLDGPLAPVAEWPGEGRAGSALAPHLMLAAERVSRERRAVALEVERPDRGSGERPTTSTVIGHPILSGRTALAAVLLELEPRPRHEVERALRQLVWGSAWLEPRTGSPAATRNSRAGIETLLDLLAVPHEHERFGAAATAFASELATRFGCQQVSLGFVEAGRVRLRALSHSARFSAKTNLNRAREAAMEEALDQQADVMWPSPSDGVLQVTQAHERLASLAEAGAICSLLFSHGPRFRGVVTLERAAGQPFFPTELELLRSAIGLTGPLLEVQRRDDRWIGPKLLESVRETLARLAGPRHVALKLGAFAALALLAFLALAKGSHRVSADSVLEARELRAAVAPFDGYVSEAPARPGDRVRPGDLLASLDDRELRLEEARFASQVEQLENQYRQAIAERNGANLRIVMAQLGQVRAQLKIAHDRLAKTRVEAPIEGIVVSGDLSQALGAPVERGGLLFEVAPLGDYRLALRVDEREIEEISVGQRGSVTFAALPGESYAFTVEKVTPISEAGEGKNTFRVEAELEQIPERLQPGMEGVAKVEIDRRRLLWIWTHGAVDWLRLALWRWLP